MVSAVDPDSCVAGNVGRFATASWARCQDARRVGNAAAQSASRAQSSKVCSSAAAPFRACHSGIFASSGSVPIRYHRAHPRRMRAGVVLRHARAVGDAEQVELCIAERGTYRLDVGDDVRGGVLRGIGVGRQRQPAAAHGLRWVHPRQRRRPFELGAAQRTRLAGAARIDQQDVAVFAVGGAVGGVEARERQQRCARPAGELDQRRPRRAGAFAPGSPSGAAGCVGPPVARGFPAPATRRSAPRVGCPRRGSRAARGLIPPRRRCPRAAAAGAAPADVTMAREERQRETLRHSRHRHASCTQA